MRSRRDLKKEKAMRNLDYARQHRKRTPNRYQKKFTRTVADKTDEDFLAMTFSTLKFGADAKSEQEGDGQQKGGAQKDSKARKSSRATAGAKK